MDAVLKVKIFFVSVLAVIYLLAAVPSQEVAHQLYVIAACLGAGLLIVFGLVVYLLIVVKRLKMAYNKNFQTNMTSANILPYEELAKRGFTMYRGSNDRNHSATSTSTTRLHGY